MKVATWMDAASESYFAWCYSPVHPFEVCCRNYGLLQHAVEKTAKGESSWGGLFEIELQWFNFGLQRTRGSVKETADELMSRIPKDA